MHKLFVRTFRRRFPLIDTDLNPDLAAGSAAGSASGVPACSPSYTLPGAIVPLTIHSGCALTRSAWWLREQAGTPAPSRRSGLKKGAAEENHGGGEVDYEASDVH